MNINEILEDLYGLDPALRSEEAELKEIIKKLLEKKPEAEADEDFKERLKNELLAEVEQRRKRTGFFIIHRKMIVRAAGIAAAVIVVLTFALQPGLLSSILSPNRMTATEMADSTVGLEALEPEMHEAEPAAGLTIEQPTESRDDSAAQQKKPAEAAEAAEPAAQKVETSKEESVYRSAVTPGEVPAQGLSAPAPREEVQPMLKRSLEKSMVYEAEDKTAAWGEGAELLAGVADTVADEQPDTFNEEYREIVENDFIKAALEPVSTFSIDVDTASYSNIRRYINSGMLPHPDAVRIEELINYFTYDYRQPDGDVPFSITTELSDCPWNSSNRLLHIGLQGFDVEPDELPPTNLVFLLDSSGSMQDDNKLPLLKDSMSLLIDTLRPEDRVSIVAYAGSAGLVLPPTAGNRKRTILAAIDRIEAGGSTAGGAGIDLAYRTAAENYFTEGNNRVILATDGDFNVGQSSEEELRTMIEQRRDQGIYLTVLGLGMGNYKDARMEALADNGNGNYAYIDTLNEANKVLITELSSTLLTIAKDVKIQIDFNEEAVDSYRLIGYENRLMAAEDFSNDKKDAGEIGAGHSVTALYEIIPARTGMQAAELAEIRFRYKNPDEDQSQLIVSTIENIPVQGSKVTDNFMFSAAVAEWGMLLRGSDYAANFDIRQIIKRASAARGPDPYGYRAEFLELLEKTDDLLK